MCMGERRRGIAHGGHHHEQHEIERRSQVVERTLRTPPESTIISPLRSTARGRVNCCRRARAGQRQARVGESRQLTGAAPAGEALAAGSSALGFDRPRC
eukprot:scaffold93710_cov28-Tisochrysis_lutea.AAC.2